MEELVVKKYPKSSITEAIKNIKANLRFSSINEKVKTILITSSVSGEGKSFISANLAATYAGPNSKVLLIDCDMRRGRQKNLFNIKNYDHLGLSNLLIDEMWVFNLKKYVHNTDIPNLDVIANGSIPPNPNILLESIKIENVMEELKKKYDIIILDAPPVTGLADALILSRLADAVIIVARAEKATFEMLEATKNALENVNANIVGAILNGVSKTAKSMYNGYYGYISGKED